MLDKDEETFWREMERMPDLQKLVARYGRYTFMRGRGGIAPTKCFRHGGASLDDPEQRVNHDAFRARRIPGATHECRMEKEMRMGNGPQRKPECRCSGTRSEKQEQSELCHK
jgi:hypothetical protein